MRLEGAHSGVDAEGRLVLVVPHLCREDRLPGLVEGLRLLPAAFSVGPVDFLGASAATHADRYSDGPPSKSLSELLEREQAEIAENEHAGRGEEQVRARGSFTLQLPALEAVSEYRLLAGELERALWALVDHLQDSDGAP